MRTFSTYMVKKLKDKETAAVFLKTALEEYEADYDIKAFMLALRDIAEAQGGLTELAKHCNISRQHLYRVFSGGSSPKLDTFDSILHGLGYRLSVEPLRKTG